MHAPAREASPHSEAKLRRLNAEYVEAFLRSDADWHQRHLAEEFRCVLADGEVVDRAAFLDGAIPPIALKLLGIEDVSVQFDGDTAVVETRVAYEKPDGTREQCRCTDLWIGRDGRWQTLNAQITRIAQQP